MRLGKTAVVVEQLLKEASQIAETEAVKRAGLSVPVTKKRRGKKSEPETPSLAIDGTIKSEDILSDVEGASGPSNVQGQACSEPNPHWPNVGSPWSHQFAPLMTKALTKAVNLGAKRLAASLSKNLGSYLSGVVQHLTDEVRQTERHLSESHDASRMRLDVLWWSEALYSPSLNRGYREMESPITSVFAAADLSAIVPALAPASVNYVLGEAILRLSQIRGEQETQPLGSYFEALTKAKNDFGDIFHPVNNEMRLPLLSLIADASGGVKQTAKIVLSRAGLDISLNLSPSEFAMWIFRDLQARRLVEELRG